MSSDPKILNISQRLLDCFNGSSVSLLADLCDPALTVYSGVLGGDRRSNALVREPIAPLIAACRGKFPGVRFFSESVRLSDIGFVFSWIGNFQPQEEGSPLVKIPCTCRVTLTGDRLRELWFAIDEYEVLTQLGKVCMDPGHSTGNSSITNRLAAESLRSAIVTRRTTCDSLHPDTLLHANIEIYTDLKTGVGTEIFRVEGENTIGEVLAYLRERLGEPVELSFHDGISQGYTTTFRGKIRGKVGAEMQRYDLVCGFVSPTDRVTECWVKVTPPPTLMECLT